MVSGAEARTRHVAVLVESSRGFGRGLIEGISCYCREHDDWCTYFEPRSLESLPSWLDGWEGDGIIARMPTREMAIALEQRGQPVVQLLHCAADNQPMVAVNARAVARLAFEHFWDIGLRHFGVCGMGSLYRSIERRGFAFQQLAEDAGCDCSLYTEPRLGLMVMNWDREEHQVASWLASLPKPVGIFAGLDEYGLMVLHACRRAKLQVPDEVAVIGVDNDAILCETCLPTLSSIDVDAPRIGYRAAELLEEMMGGPRRSTEPILLDPYRLVARRSTDVLAFADPKVLTAMQFIRAHACAGICVDDVMRHVSISQSVLERKFKRALGKTPKSVILGVQIARAKELLLETTVPIKVVAEKSGFNSERYFSDAFTRTTGDRPGAFRIGRRRVAMSPR